MQMEVFFLPNINPLYISLLNNNQQPQMVKIASWAAKIAPLMKQDFLKIIKAQITCKRIAATEGTWMQSGGIQM